MAIWTKGRLRSEVLNLPDADRAELARDLVRSLDGPSGADTAKAWDSEILCRLDEITAGSTRIIDRAEFARRVRKRVHGAGS